ncbi:hypothetical protein [Janthinobacterium sp. PAMC25594]|uniref:hypothetical protein n=1 Tax=Janthinobacterium sp. PAMC25594 TaxID=2861284 RepID=UPI001C62F52F|nr:hypothetical protein [Janthinobacterium sp. PAMC25594]QYG06252.1 hypothetical protein KY494_23755 [Janthinobacterium sp. PAMC25594]
MIFKNSVLAHFKIPAEVAAGLPSLLKFRGMTVEKFFEIAAVKFFEELEEETQEAVEKLEKEAIMAKQALAIDAAIEACREQIRAARGQQ